MNLFSLDGQGFLNMSNQLIYSIIIINSCIHLLIHVPPFARAALPALNFQQLTSVGA